MNRTFEEVLDEAVPGGEKGPLHHLDRGLR